MFSCKTKIRESGKHPTIAFIFDDGCKSDFELIKPLFEQRGIRCGFEIITRLINGDRRLTFENIYTLQKGVFEILPHSVNHFEILNEIGYKI